MLKKVSILLTALLFQGVLFAQNAAPQEQDFFRSSGKIYVVVAVIGIIFVGIIAFLIWLETRLSRLEKQQK
jgi:uncharacterized integral membrane protein